MPWILLPEAVALITFILKRIFRDDKLPRLLVNESIRRLAPQEVDCATVTGLQTELVNALELDSIRKDIQAASLAAFSGGIVLAFEKPSESFMFILVIAWLALTLFTGRLAALPESARDFRKLKALQLIGFAGLWSVSVAVKCYRLFVAAHGP